MPVMKCKSTNELLNMLIALQNTTSSGPWYFRGQAKSSWRLDPSLYRLKLSNEKQYESDLLYALKISLRTRSELPV